MTTDAQRLAMGRAILDFEARRDRATGNVAVYRLPSGDGGGTFEVCGINDRYHATKAWELRRLIEAGHPKQAEDAAASYIADYTDAAELCTSVPAIEFYLRDCVFNRGPRGAVAILQEALRKTVGGKSITVDGRLGPITREALRAHLAAHPVREFVAILREAREKYERTVYSWKPSKRGPGNKFWVGLVHRWDRAALKALDFA